MKLSLTSLFAMTSCIALLISPLNADINKGRSVYMKTCKSCHGDGPKGTAMKTQEGWEEMFANNGQAIIQKHSATKVKPYFEGDTFKSQAGDLRDFLHEYGSDSGNVLTCG